MLIMMVRANIESVCTVYAFESNSDKSRRFLRRKRHCVSDMFTGLGPIYTRRSYRMTDNEFWKLYRFFSTYYPKKTNCKRKRSNIGSNPDSIPNKKIDLSLQLGVAIRYFAGGCPLDIV